MGFGSMAASPVDQQEKPELRDELSTDVFLLKLIPNTNPRLFDHLAEIGYRGVVLETFGAGGMHFHRRDLLEKLRMLEARGIVVVACSQCLYGAQQLHHLRGGAEAAGGRCDPGGRYDHRSRCDQTHVGLGAGDQEPERGAGAVPEKSGRGNHGINKNKQNKPAVDWIPRRACWRVCSPARRNIKCKEEREYI